jgi:hypothetical protein
MDLSITPPISMMVLCSYRQIHAPLERGTLEVSQPCFRHMTAHFLIVSLRGFPRLFEHGVDEGVVDHRATACVDPAFVERLPLTLARVSDLSALRHNGDQPPYMKRVPFGERVADVKCGRSEDNLWRWHS